MVLIIFQLITILENQFKRKRFHDLISFSSSTVRLCECVFKWIQIKTALQWAFQAEDTEHVAGLPMKQNDGKAYGVKKQFRNVHCIRAKVQQHSQFWLEGLAPFVCIPTIYQIHDNLVHGELDSSGRHQLMPVPGPYGRVLELGHSPQGDEEVLHRAVQPCEGFPRSSLSRTHNWGSAHGTEGLPPTNTRLLFMRETRRRLDQRFTDLLMAVRLPAAVNSIARGAALHTFNINYLRRAVSQAQCAARSNWLSV